MSDMYVMSHVRCSLWDYTDPLDIVDKMSRITGKLKDIKFRLSTQSINASTSQSLDHKS